MPLSQGIDNLHGRGFIKAFERQRSAMTATLRVSVSTIDQLPSSSRLA
ncbi:hypothetical protein [Rhizobium sp. 007]|nr:hypothetical protein [Rhizobium sp. 007]QPB22612.1 hypothetical protein ISN39_23745 [Rhizobium sp. 007]